MRKGDSSGMRVDDGTKACPKAPPPPTNEVSWCEVAISIIGRGQGGE